VPHLTDLALSRASKVVLSLIVVVIASLLVWGLLSDSGSGGSAASAGSSTNEPVPAQTGYGSSAAEKPQSPPVETLRQRSLR